MPGPPVGKKKKKESEVTYLHTFTEIILRTCTEKNDLFFPFDFFFIHTHETHNEKEKQ